MLGQPGCGAWSEAVAELVAGQARGNPRLRPEPDARTPHLWSTEWSGLPQRAVSCLGRPEALSLLDWPGGDGSGGRRRLQEEYVEWRAVRGVDGRLRRVELTTELPEYWAVVAAHEPERLLACVARFADVGRVDPAKVYGDCDPLADSTTPAQRGAAFIRTMVRGSSPYNSGGRAICCMIQPTNTLAGLVSLVGAALRTRTVQGPDGAGAARVLAAEDLLPFMTGLAVPGRASDPLLAERVARLAWDGRTAAFDDPVGVYIHGAQLGRLRTPDGEPVPPEWLVLSRGVAAGSAAGGSPRWQRAVFEVPPEAGYELADLVDVATEAPLSYGGQVAELLQIAVHLRVSDGHGLPAAATLLTSAGPATDAAGDGCADVRSFLAESLS